MTVFHKRGDYLSFVEALQSCLLARDCAVSIVRFEKADVEESGVCCQTAGNFKMLGCKDKCNRKAGSKRNDDKECKKYENLLGSTI